MQRLIRRANSISWTAVGPLFEVLGVRPTFRLTARHKALYALYVMAWHFALPGVFLYFWLRGRREPLYRRHWQERFGLVARSSQRPLWIHCASLGELRGVMPLIDRLLSEGHGLLITTLTPAGRMAAQSRYAAALQSGQVLISYLPLELPWAIRCFAQRVQPRGMLSTEIDTWPVLLKVLRDLGVPCGFVNAGYPEKSFVSDQRGLAFRAAFFAAYDLVLCKSSLHAERFARCGCANVHAVGEIRFDLDVAPSMLHAADQLRMSLTQTTKRPIFTLASVVEAEEERMIEAMLAYRSLPDAQRLNRPLWIYVPRSAQRFDAVDQLLQQAGLRVLRRTQCLTADLQSCVDADEWHHADVLLGDSFGEMHFYLRLSDHVTVGGSFSPKGSHNIIEPLALRKPVLVGPVIWTIEYPAREALDAGVLTQVRETSDIPAQWLASLSASDTDFSSRIDAFVHQHADSTARHWTYIHAWLQQQH